MKACVVIPTLNACDMLAEALESLAQQSGPADVVVVDNASTDGTREMLASRFPEVTTVVYDAISGSERRSTGASPQRRRVPT